MWSGRLKATHELELVCVYVCMYVATQVMRSHGECRRHWNLFRYPVSRLSSLECLDEIAVVSQKKVKGWKSWIVLLIVCLRLRVSAFAHSAQSLREVEVLLRKKG